MEQIVQLAWSCRGAIINLICICNSNLSHDVAFLMVLPMQLFCPIYRNVAFLMNTEISPYYPVLRNVISSLHSSNYLNIWNWLSLINQAKSFNW